MHEIAPKFITSKKKINKVLPGFHDLEFDGNNSNYFSTRLAICHFPFTSLERFRIKIEGMKNHMKHMEKNLAKGHGWHWKRWIEDLRTDDEIVAEYKKQFFNMSQLLYLTKNDKIKSFEKYFSSVQPEFTQ